MKTVAFYTLGCKVNQYETAALASLFARRGYRIVEDFESVADVYVINTCTVTGTAAQKSRQAIRRAIRRNPEAVVVVTGCYAQVDPEAVAGIPGVDVVVGTFGREGLVDSVEEAMRTGRQVVTVREFPARCEFEELPALFTTRTRAYLKIQEGCRDFCTFCLVPYARGPLRSRKPEAVLAEARRLVAAGFKEVVLTGIHVGLYGCDLQPPVTLAELIARVLELPGIARLRLSSLEPTEVTPELVALLARDSRFCPHLHIPLQSGDDEVLRRMGRRYTTATYAEMVRFLRAQVPEIAITTDVMVGFPGETDAAFVRSVTFVQQIGFAGLHVFKFSPRPGTPAATFPDQVPEPVKEKRLRFFLEVDAALNHAFAVRFSGRMVNVLVEGKSEAGFWEGLSEHYFPVVFTGGRDLRGLVVPVRVREVKGRLLCGELLTEYSKNCTVE